MEASRLRLQRPHRVRRPHLLQHLGLAQLQGLLQRQGPGRLRLLLRGSNLSDDKFDYEKEIRFSIRVP